MSERCRIIIGDSRTALAGLPEKSVRCCVTSPPYWGLRDYGVAGQIGLEPTHEAWVAEMVAVFGQVRRVLADDGTLWVNVGDAYAVGKCGRADSVDAGRFGGPRIEPKQRKAPDGLKPKDLIGLPWMLAFALRADGWYLRSDIIWAKPNPMPESVTDRPTKSHEYVFLFSKSPRYFFDAGAIAEASATEPHSRGGVEKPGQTEGPMNRNGHSQYDAAQQDRAWGSDTRNARSVWSIPTQGYSGAHFATFPRELAARCIKAGSAVGDLVLDPFLGTGTTIAEALLLGRRGVGVELNPEYAKLAEKRIAETCSLLAMGGAA